MNADILSFGHQFFAVVQRIHVGVAVVRVIALRSFGGGFFHERFAVVDY